MAFGIGANRARIDLRCAERRKNVTRAGPEISGFQGLFFFLPLGSTDPVTFRLRLFTWLGLSHSAPR